MTPDEFDERAREICERIDFLGGGTSFWDEVASAIAAALRDADQAGYRRAVDECIHQVTNHEYRCGQKKCHEAFEKELLAVKESL